jgi:hypothetical protein
LNQFFNEIESAGAVKAGVECLEQIERIYFQRSETQQVPNLVAFHAKNLTAPAVEIEGKYLTDLHERISGAHEEDEQK